MQFFIFYSFYIFFLIAALAVWVLIKNKKSSSRIISLVVLFISLFFIYGRFIEPRILIAAKENKIEAFIEDSIETATESSNANPVKIVVFSDLHYGVYKNAISLNRIVKKINKEKPDLVLIPGDFAYFIDKEKIESELAELGKIEAPVYAVTGNHDDGNFDEEDVSEEVKIALEKAGVNVIDNKIERIKAGSKEITLLGLEDYWNFGADYSLLENLEEKENTIVLTHNPDSVYKFLKEANVDLAICGHTHGGQIRFPFFYKYAIPTKYDFDRGLHDVNGIKVYVSSGIGMVGLPMRFLVPPRIDILEIF